MSFDKEMLLLLGSILLILFGIFLEWVLNHRKGSRLAKFAKRNGTCAKAVVRNAYFEKNGSYPDDKTLDRVYHMWIASGMCDASLPKWVIRYITKED